SAVTNYTKKPWSVAGSFSSLCRRSVRIGSLSGRPRRQRSIGSRAIRLKRMNRPSRTGATPAEPAAAPDPVTLSQILLAFLMIGPTSIGGGLVAYLRRGLVTKRGWVDDRTFVQMLSVSEALPGLNGTNIAILAGDHLRGARGAIAAIFGMCLPGALI